MMLVFPSYRGNFSTNNVDYITWFRTKDLGEAANIDDSDSSLISPSVRVISCAKLALKFFLLTYFVPYKMWFQRTIFVHIANTGDSDFFNSRPLLGVVYFVLSEGWPFFQQYCGTSETWFSRNTGDGDFLNVHPLRGWFRGFQGVKPYSSNMTL